MPSRINKICKNCKQDFIAARKEQIYCSYKCSSEGSRRGRPRSDIIKKKISVSHVGKKLSKNTKNKISNSLKGREFSEETKLKISISKKGNKNIWGSGRDNPNWKGGVTEENKLARTNIEITLWKQSVFARDHWTCQKCGRTGCITLNAHHIKNFYKYKEVRTAIDNGITLCKQCHKMFHKIYGNRDNNMEQIKEYIN